MKYTFLTMIAVLILTVAAGFQTAAAQSKVPAKDASLIAFLVKDSEMSAETAQSVPFLGIIIGKTNYIVNPKTGKVISQNRAANSSGGYYGAYAEVQILLLDQDKHESGGASRLVKLSGARWKTVALNETDYQCADLKSVPKATLKALKIECN